MALKKIQNGEFIQNGLDAVNFFSESSTGPTNS
jgi:hypothetical protein